MASAWRILTASDIVSTTASPRQQRAVQDLHELTIIGDIAIGLSPA